MIVVVAVAVSVGVGVAVAVGVAVFDGGGIVADGGGPRGCGKSIMGRSARGTVKKIGVGAGVAVARGDVDGSFGVGTTTTGRTVAVVGRTGTRAGGFYDSAAVDAGTTTAPPAVGGGVEQPPSHERLTLWRAQWRLRPVTTDV